MKRIYFIVFAIIAFSTGGVPQKGNNSIGAGGELNFPTGDFGDRFKTGFGLYAKGLFGIGKAGQVTITTGYSGFKERGTWDDYSATVNIIPLFIGYRHYFNSLFIEPQLGYAVYGSKYTSFEDGSRTESDGAINAAANIGYLFSKQLEISARYQTGGKQGWNVNMFGLRAGYNFSLKPAKK